MTLRCANHASSAAPIVETIREPAPKNLGELLYGNGIVDEVQRGIDALGMRGLHCRYDVLPVVGDELVDAQRPRKALVRRAARSDHVRAAAFGHLYGETSDAAGRAEHEQHRALRNLQRIQSG